MRKSLKRMTREDRIEKERIKEGRTTLNIIVSSYAVVFVEERREVCISLPLFFKRQEEVVQEDVSCNRDREQLCSCCIFLDNTMRVHNIPE